MSSGYEKSDPPVSLAAASSSDADGDLRLTLCGIGGQSAVIDVSSGITVQELKREALLVMDYGENQGIRLTMGEKVLEADGVTLESEGVESGATIFISLLKLVRFASGDKLLEVKEVKAFKNEDRKMMDSIKSAVGDAADSITSAASSLKSKIVDTAQSRIEAAREGKRIVDESGPATQDTLLAKKIGNDAMRLEDKSTTNLYTVVQMYTDAAARLRSVAVQEGSSEVDDLAANYEMRVVAITTMLEQLEALEQHALSAAERDAVKILGAKELGSKLIGK